MNRYRQFVSEFERLLQKGKSLNPGTISKARCPKIPSNAPNVLVFSPHPDDECLIGGQGGAAPDFTFATLYRLRRWKMDASKMFTRAANKSAPLKIRAAGLI